jgi:DNA-binding response OmpR family regulator
VRILLVEDSPEVGANVAADGATGLRLAIGGGYDVVVLDRMLPRMEGLEVCRRLRTEQGPGAPVMFLTARDELEDKLEGFDAGADDYVVKPFELAELVARVEALGRRAATRRAEEAPVELRFEGLTYHLGRREARRGERELKLNRVGHRILQELLRVAPDVVTRERLEQLLWEGYSPGGSVLRTHIYALRKAVDAPGEAPRIETVHGVGYRLAGGAGTARA